MKPSRSLEKSKAHFDCRYPALLGAGTIGITYFMAALLGVALRAHAGTSVFWPAAGIALGALIVWGPWARLPVATGVLVATVIVNLMVGKSAWLAGAFALVNVGQVLLAGILLERWFGRAFKFGNVSQVLAFLVATAVGSAAGAIGATIAVGFAQSLPAFFTVWRFWFTSSLLGMVTVAPVLVGVAAAVRQVPSRRELIEGVAGIVLLVVSSAVVISLPQGAWSTALPLVVVFPLLLWIAARCRSHARFSTTCLRTDVTSCR